MTSGHGLPCTYCARQMQTDVEVSHPLYATRDHYFPRSKNNGHPNRKVWACYQCNQIKADREPIEWERFMLRNPRWWTLPTWNEEHRATAAKLPAPEKPKAPPLWKTLRFLRNAEFRDWIEPADIPVRYDDPLAQAAFEAAYKNRKYMLRSPPPAPLNRMDA